MIRRTPYLVIVASLVGLSLVSGARADNVVLPRPGQVGIAVQGGYGNLFETGVFGQDFGSGATLAVRLRYRMRFERGVGLSFESQSFDVRQPGSADTSFSTLNLIMSGVEFYQMFGTRTKTTRMLSVGAGLVQASSQLNDGETFFFPGSDGIYVSAGAEVERFFFRSLAYDLSLRYFSVFKEGEANHQLQAALGLIFYAGY